MQPASPNRTTECRLQPLENKKRSQVSHRSIGQVSGRCTGRLPPPASASATNETRGSHGHSKNDPKKRPRNADPTPPPSACRHVTQSAARSKHASPPKSGGCQVLLGIAALLAAGHSPFSILHSRSQQTLDSPQKVPVTNRGPAPELVWPFPYLPKPVSLVLSHRSQYNSYSRLPKQEH